MMKALRDLFVSFFRFYKRSVVSSHLLKISEAKDVEACMVGTTHFLNACVQRVGLAKVCVMRFCGTATLALPPFSDMPSDLMSVIGARHFLLSGKELWQFHVQYIVRVITTGTSCLQIAARYVGSFSS